MAWDPINQKIVIFTYPMLDGAGDFSTTKKMIEKLISMEICPENIYLVIVNIYDKILEHYKNMESEFKKNCHPSQPVIKHENLNVDFDHRTVSDKDKIIKDDSNFTITGDIFYHISTILNYLCQYNKFFEPKTNCDEMDDSHLSLSDMKAELYKLLKKVKNDYKKTPHEFPYRCTLNGEILNKFLLTGTNVRFWYTWIKNVSSFLMPFKAKGVNLKIGLEVGKSNLKEKLRKVILKVDL
jgi:hypothetical protein